MKLFWLVQGVLYCVHPRFLSEKTERDDSQRPRCRSNCGSGLPLQIILFPVLPFVLYGLLWLVAAVGVDPPVIVLADLPHSHQSLQVLIGLVRVDVVQRATVMRISVRRCEVDGDLQTKRPTGEHRFNIISDGASLPVWPAKMSGWKIDPNFFHLIHFLFCLFYFLLLLRISGGYNPDIIQM